MSVTRYRSGDATVTLSMPKSLEIRAIVSRALGGALEAMEEPMEALAAEARLQWYGPNGVERETGASGDIQVVTTVDVNKGEVRVGVGSTDMSTVAMRARSAKDKANDPHVDAYRVRFIHRPSTNTLRAREVTEKEWWTWKRRGAPTLPPPTDKWWTGTDGDGKRNGRGLKHGAWYIQTTDSAGKPAVPPTDKTYRMLPNLVTNPGKKLAKKIASDVASKIAQAVNRG